MVDLPDPVPQAGRSRSGTSIQINIFDGCHLVTVSKGDIIKYDMTLHLAWHQIYRTFTVFDINRLIQRSSTRSPDALTACSY